MTTSFRWRVFVGALLSGFGLFAFAPLITFTLLSTHLIRLHMLHIVAASVTGTIALIFGVIQIRRGLSPFVELRARLAAVKDGQASRLEGRYPSEVQPLANELNAFLAHREKVVQNAIAKAGDLAHGLKTPLAILTREAERAAAAGQDELATVMHQQIERMRRQIEYHLAHARAAASKSPTGARTSVLESVEGLIRALQRLHAERQFRFDVSIAATDDVRVLREDFDEILGNLLDNACKWGRSRIAISSSSDDGQLAIVVDDDGAGIAAAMRDAVLQRGVRADEAAPGQGLGLAIAREIAELYGGTLTLGESPLGGVRARLSVPAISSETTAAPGTSGR
jgi:signal transduction histidine kinase